MLQCNVSLGVLIPNEEGEVSIVMVKGTNTVALLLMVMGPCHSHVMLHPHIVVVVAHP